ncbi:MAG TPA: hypothetical protein VIS74_05655 [Chthoniobacterales bacterium]
MQAQEFYTTPTSNQPTAVQQTIGNAGIAQDLGVASSGRSQDAAPSTASSPDQAGGGSGGESKSLSFFDLAGGTRNPFKISASIREGYDDNTLTTRTDRKGSFYTNLAAGISYDFGSPRLRLNTNLTGGVAYYYTRPGRKLDLSLIYTLSAVYAASSRLTLGISSTIGWYPQPDVGIAGTPFNNQDGSYFYTSTNVDATYQWTSRFSTTTAYTFRALSYSDQDLNEGQGNISQTLSQSFNFQLWPTTTLVAEYRANAITYFDADLNSFGNYALLGFNHVFNPRSRWNLRGGLEQRFNNNPVDGKDIYVGPFAESIFIYRFTSRSEVAWSTRYGTEQSGLTDVTQRQTFRTGISVNHGFTARLSGTFDLFYAVSYYDQPGVIPDYYQNVFQANLGLNFALNRLLSLSTGYQFTGALSPQQLDQEYYRNIVYLGLNANF